MNGIYRGGRASANRPDGPINRRLPPQDFDPLGRRSLDELLRMAPQTYSSATIGKPPSIDWRKLHWTVARRLSAIPPKGHPAASVEMTPSTIETVCVRARSILMSPYLPGGRTGPDVCHERFFIAVRAASDQCRAGCHCVERSGQWLKLPGFLEAILVGPLWRGISP
jgi:hypothetical protein